MLKNQDFKIYYDLAHTLRMCAFLKNILCITNVVYVDFCVYLDNIPMGSKMSLS